MTLNRIRTLLRPHCVISRNAPKLTREYTSSDVALPSDATVVSVIKLTMTNAITAEIVNPRVLARISCLNREGSWPFSARVYVILVTPKVRR